MKRAVLILAVLLVASSVAFASPNASFGTWGRTILNLAAGSSSNSDITQWWGPDGWGPCQRVQFVMTSDAFDLNIKYDIKQAGILSTTYGAKYAAIASIDPATGAIVYDQNDAGEYYSVSPVTAVNAVSGFQNAYATLRFVPDLLTVHLGKITGDGIDNFRKTSEHSLRDMNLDNVGRFGGNGLVAIVAPKGSNFEAGIFWDMPSYDNTSYSVIKTVLRTGLAASYTITDTAKITVGSLGSGTSGDNAVRNVFGRVELLMVKGLNLWADVKYEGLEPQSVTLNDAKLQALIAGSYTMDALKIIWGAKLKDELKKNDSAYYKMTWTISPEFQYKMGDMTLGLEAQVDSTLDNASTDSGINIDVEPYVKLNKFNTRISFEFNTNTKSGNYTWKLPLTVDVSLW